MKSLLMLLGVLSVAYLALVALVYVMQPRLLYLPDVAGRELAATPATIGLAYETVRLTTADGVALQGWFVPAGGSDRVLLFFHGNAGNISHRLDSLRIFHALGLDVLIFDYRGYGRSEGRPTESGTYADATAAWQWLRTERGYRPDQIVLFGRSMGAAIAAELATRSQPGGLILESAFTSVPDLARRYYWYLPVRLLSRFRYATAAHVERVAAPVLIVHSRDDEIVPYEHALAIHARTRSPKTLLTITGDHNSGFLVSEAQYMEGLERFLESLPAG